MKTQRKMIIEGLKRDAESFLTNIWPKLTLKFNGIQVKL
jgi:hypothetical protein